MSADNWAICPRCLAEAKAAADKARAEVYAKYGKIPVAAFDKLREDLSEIDPEDYRTLREYYEFYGAEQGTVTADYSSSCDECGLKVALNANKTFWPES